MLPKAAASGQAAHTRLEASLVAFVEAVKMRRLTASTHFDPA